MSYEKISNIPIRREKIRRLKEKITMEIEKEIELCKKDLIYDLTVKIDKEEFDNTIEIIHRLNKLKEYIDYDWSFMCDTYKDSKRDIIVYEVSIKNIDIWLQDDYVFINKIISDTRDGLIIENALNDDYYFAYEYLSIFDTLIYDERGKK